MLFFLFIFWQVLTHVNVKLFIVIRNYDVQYFQALFLIQLDFMCTRFIFIHLLLQRNHLAGSKKKKKMACRNIAFPGCASVLISTICFLFSNFVLRWFDMFCSQNSSTEMSSFDNFQYSKFQVTIFGSLTTLQSRWFSAQSLTVQRTKSK